jgi:hypothetical protein
MNQQRKAPPAPPAAASPWAPLRRLLWLCLAVSVPTAGAAIAWLAAGGAPMRWELLLAVAGGITGTLLLAGALMGLVFVSNRSGHDASVGQADSLTHDTLDD